MTVKRLLLVTVLAVLVLVIVRAVFFSKEPAPQVRTVEVQRGAVRTVVTGTGTLQPVSQRNLSFAQVGRLTELNVLVGDRVRPGQVLARIDPDESRTVVQEAVGGLQQAQATLKNAREQNAVEIAQTELEAARQALGDTKEQVEETIEAGEARIVSDRRRLEFDRATLERNEERLERDEERLERDRETLEEARRRFHEANCDDPLSSQLPPCPALAQAVQQGQGAVDASRVKVEQDRDAVRASRAQVLADEAQLSADERQLAIDRATGQKAINDARARVSAADEALESELINRPNEIALQQGAVTSAQARVDRARLTLDDTTLFSEWDATVVSVSAQVGERVAPSGLTTPLSPGTNAPQPPIATAVTPGALGGATGGAVASAFIVLGDVRAFQVVVPLAEADAAGVQQGQRADVTFDALPGLTLPATVRDISPVPVIIQNVTNYFVTLDLAQLDPRLRAGLTANAEIVAAEVQNVLVVPNAAIQRVGDQTFVTVLLDDGTQRRVPVQTGVVGDTTTQIIEGLKPGDRVVLPTVRVPSGQPPPASPGGG